MDNDRPLGEPEMDCLPGKVSPYPYAAWTVSINLRTNDGYRTQHLEFQLGDAWSTRDAGTCLEVLAMSMGGLLHAVAASGIVVSGGDPAEAFSEALAESA